VRSKSLIILFAGALFLIPLLSGCSQSRTYYGAFNKEMGGNVYAFLMIKDSDKAGRAEIHFIGEKENAEGTYVREGDHLSINFPDPHDPKQSLSLDVTEKHTDSGWVVEGNFHWDFGGKLGIDGTLRMTEYKGQQ
jgi:hypothetical protein